MDWVPCAGELISPAFPCTHYTSSGKKRNLLPGEMFVVVYSESSDHGTDSHNISVFHPDIGVSPIIVRKGYWNILNRQEG
jgi:hypothetical protein